MNPARALRQASVAAEIQEGQGPFPCTQAIFSLWKKFPVERMYVCVYTHNLPRDSAINSKATHKHPYLLVSGSRKRFPLKEPSSFSMFQSGAIYILSPCVHITHLHISHLFQIRTISKPPRGSHKILPHALQCYKASPLAVPDPYGALQRRCHMHCNNCRTGITALGDDRSLPLGRKMSLFYDSEVSSAIYEDEKWWVTLPTVAREE